MTPKEKAKDLFKKMLDNIPSHYDEVDMAKQCALIAVEEIIDELKNPSTPRYWNKVKEEIEKL